VEIQYETSRKQAYEARRDYLMQFSLIRILNRFGWLIFPGCFFICFLLKDINFGASVEVNGEPVPVLSAVVSLLYIIAYALMYGLVTNYVMRHLGKSYIKRAIGKLPDNSFGCKKVSLGTEAITIQTPAVKAEYSWELFSGFEETSDYIIIKVHGTILTFLPKTVFSDAQEQKSFVEELASHSKGALPKSGDVPIAEGTMTAARQLAQQDDRFRHIDIRVVAVAIELTRKLGIYIFLPVAIFSALLIAITAGPFFSEFSLGHKLSKESVWFLISAVAFILSTGLFVQRKRPRPFLLILAGGTISVMGLIFLVTLFWDVLTGGWGKDIGFALFGLVFGLAPLLFGLALCKYGFLLRGTEKPTKQED